MDKAVDKATDAVEKGKDAVEGAVDDAKKAVDDAIDAANKAVEDAKNKANDVVDEIYDKAKDVSYESLGINLLSTSWYVDIENDFTPLKLDTLPSMSETYHMQRLSFLIVWHAGHFNLYWEHIWGERGPLLMSVECYCGERKKSPHFIGIWDIVRKWYHYFQYTKHHKSLVSAYVH